MVGFEPWIFEIGSDCYANCGTKIALHSNQKSPALVPAQKQTHLKDHSRGFDDHGVDGGCQGDGQQPGVGLEELLVLGRLVHERDQDDPEQDDGEHGAEDQAQLQPEGRLAELEST